MVTLLKGMTLTAKWEPGLGFKSTPIDNKHPFLPGEAKKNDVTLAINSMHVAADFNHEATSEVTLSATGYDKLALNLHLQLLESGKHAEIFKEIPSNSDPARIALSQQATNYLLTALYGEEELHIGISKENPFTQLDRLTLSNMAFDETGAFTSAERQVAFLEMAKRDDEFITRTADYQIALKGKNDTVYRSEHFAFLRDAHLASAMSEEERAWRGWPTADELAARASSLMREPEVKKLDFSAMYGNLKGQEDSVLLVATGEIDEQPVWRGIPVKTLDPKGTSIALIQAAVIDPVSSKPIFQAVDSNVGEWLSLYASIGNFKST